jgi:hypothetical protein
MTTINPSGMKYITTHRFWQVANDLRRYANSMYDYHQAHGIDDQWYDAHRTIRTGVVKYRTTYFPKIYSAPTIRRN